MVGKATAALVAAIVFKKLRRFDWSAGEGMDWLFILFDRFKLGMTGFCAGVREAADALLVFAQKSASVSSKNSGVFWRKFVKKVDRNYVSLCHASFVEIYL
jgi:hypothetical protein